MCGTACMRFCAEVAAALRAGDGLPAQMAAWHPPLTHRLRVQTRLDEGLPLSSLAPDGHYLKSFISLNDQFDQSSGDARPPAAAPGPLRHVPH